MSGGVADEVEPDRRSTLLRRRLVHRADADVVRLGRVDLLRRVRRLADGDAEAARTRHGQIVLPEMDEVRLAEQAPGPAGR